MSNENANQIVRVIDTLIKFEIERKFAYFMDQDQRASRAEGNIEEAKSLLTSLLVAHPNSEMEK